MSENHISIIHDNSDVYTKKYHIYLDNKQIGIVYKSNIDERFNPKLKLHPQLIELDFAYKSDYSYGLSSLEAAIEAIKKEYYKIRK